MSGPSLTELRAAGQPDSVTARRNEEHWAGRRYMRRLSPYGTWVFARLGWSPNAVTWLMIVIGVGAGAVVAVGGFAAAVAAAVMIQVYLLLDCSDGELARWSRRTSVTGVYLDRVGHYLAEAALLAGLGIRAQGHYALSGSYVSVGLAAAICAILIKAETDNVIVARAKAGLAAESAGSTGEAADGAERTWEVRQARPAPTRSSPCTPAWRGRGGWPARCGCTGSFRRWNSRCSWSSPPRSMPCGAD